jgi:3-oxoacyl-[acyl-carrier-protein] synthase II
LSSKTNHLGFGAHIGEEIVIRAAAMVTCLGSDRHAVWQSVKAGGCGVAALSEIESALPPGADGGQAPPLENDDGASSREVRYLRRVIKDVLREAGFENRQAPGQFNLPYPAHRCATVMGTTLHGMRQGGAFLRRQKPSSLHEFLGTSVLHGAISGLGFEGPALTNCSACSSSLSAIALGITLLQSGRADLVVAGGYDPISEYSYGGFGSLRLIAANALRPFARDRGGMKVGEGYAVLVLEREEDAQRRGGPPVLARILGYGESADSHHLTQPHPQGAGAARAMKLALQNAGIKASEVDLVAAHATGTPDNDAAEYAALASTFGDDLPHVPVVGFKSHLSHTLGAAGAVELILSASALADQIVPPCANVKAGDWDFPGLNLAVTSQRSAEIKATMNMSLGFGGANACMILGPAGAARPRSAASVAPAREVLISGVGVMLPGAIGNEAFLARVLNAEARRVTSDAGAMDEEAIAQILSARRVRRMSGYVKLSLAAAMLALRDCGVSEPAAFCENCSAILATTHGAAQYCAEYYQGILRDGIAAANPMLFAEGVPNAAAAHLSMATGMKGSCQTIIGSRTGGLDALGLAAARIASGQWERAIVAAADEYSPLVNEAYAACGLHAPQNPSEPFGDEAGAPGGTFVTGWGAAAVVLESRQSIEARGGRARGTILGYSAGAAGADKLLRVADRVLTELADPPAVIGSANGTWVDRVEAGVVRLSANRSGRPVRVSSLGGHVAECFSAGPLAAVAAVLLSGRLPRLYGASAKHAADTEVEDFAALASDYSGLAAGVRINCARVR